jgi:hypothetical protein
MERAAADVAVPPPPPLFVPCGVYVTGLNKRVTRGLLLSHFASCGEIEDCVFSESPRQGFAWIRYMEQASADRAVLTLHHSSLLGTVLVVRPESVRDSSGKPMASRDHATPCAAPRSITVVEKNCRSKNGIVSVTYSGSGLLVGNVHYPTPQGVYLVKLLEQCHSSKGEEDRRLLDILVAPRIRHAKEITESMAIVNAVSVAGSRSGIALGLCRHVRVFSLGDGVVPFTALVMLLFMPRTWRVVCIDPLLEFDPANLGPAHASRLTCLSALSQDVDLLPYLGLPRVPIASGPLVEPLTTSTCIGEPAPLKSSEVQAAVGSNAGATLQDSGSAIELCVAAHVERSGYAEICDSTVPDVLESEPNAAGVAETAPAPPSSSLIIGRRLGSASHPLNLVIACHSHAPLQVQ